MNHLTTDELLRFVSLKTLDDDNIALTARVNTHILHCDECLKKVREFQSIIDSDDKQEEEFDVALWKSGTDDSDESSGFIGLR